MNRHFQDTRYYLERAFQTTKAGIGEELEPARSRVAAMRADDDEAEDDAGRFDRVRRELRAVRERARARFDAARRPPAAE